MLFRIIWGVSGNNNYLWADILENGPSSIYSHYFDINWHPEKKELNNKILLPVLGDHYGRVLESKEIQLSYEQGEFYIHYFARRFPVAPRTYAMILELHIEELEKKIGKNSSLMRAYLSICQKFSNLPPRTERNRSKLKLRNQKKEIAKRLLHKLVSKNKSIQMHIKSRINTLNGKKDVASSFDLLDDLINEQAYRLGHWQAASEEINYRRFFDVNDLAAIRIEDPEVFDFYHRFIFELIDQGHVQGLRIDHPDGLYDPPTYFCKLQNTYLNLKSHNKSLSQDSIANKIQLSKPLKNGTSLYVVVEKILDRQESLPSNWKVSGTVGYEFLNEVDGLFVDSTNEKKFDQLYNNFIGKKINFEQLAYERKKLFALVHMASEIRSLAYRLNQISENNRRYRDFTLNHLIVAIREVIACFPVYRTYIAPAVNDISERDSKYIRLAIAKAKQRTPSLSHQVYDFLRKVLLLEIVPEVGKREGFLYRDFILRFQQLTGPIMAKGLEDTSFYIYNRLISLNEVGGDPKHFGILTAEFHRQNLERQQHWPGGFLASSTHDTKRSEDVRARINVLSEIPQEWRVNIKHWSQLNAKHKLQVDGQLAPDRNTEYFIYQTLIGVWQNNIQNKSQNALFIQRICEYMLKAVREAKVNTNWVNPNDAYEEALRSFIHKILDRADNNLFFKQFLRFHKKINQLGMLNSLSALLLKIGSPGVVDVYQGNELWNYRLVDPDNRGVIDYDSRQKKLNDIQQYVSTGECVSDEVEEFLCSPEDSRIKLFVTACGLRLRREFKNLFIHGEYIPLEVKGRRKRNLVAFARKIDGKCMLFVVTRFFNDFDLKRDSLRIPISNWGNTRIILPKKCVAQKARNRLTQEDIELGVNKKEISILASVAFRNMSVAILDLIETE